MDIPHFTRFICKFVQKNKAFYSYSLFFGHIYLNDCTHHMKRTRDPRKGSLSFIWCHLPLMKYFCSLIIIINRAKINILLYKDISFCVTRHPPPGRGVRGRRERGGVYSFEVGYPQKSTLEDEKTHEENFLEGVGGKVIY